jgi:hypothetical protein
MMSPWESIVVMIMVYSLEKLIIVPLKTYFQSIFQGELFHNFLRDRCRPTDEEVRIPRVYLQSEIQDRVFRSISA